MFNLINFLKKYYNMNILIKIIFLYFRYKTKILSDFYNYLLILNKNISLFIFILNVCFLFVFFKYLGKIIIRLFFNEKYLSNSFLNSKIVF